MSQPILSVHKLYCDYLTRHHTIRAVDGVSFDLYSNEVLGIIGESGSGKSTLAHSLIGQLNSFTQVCEGDILFNDRSIKTFSEKDWQQLRGRHIGMIFQSAEASFNPIMTIGQHIVEALLIHQQCNQQDAKLQAINSLKMVGMSNPDKIMQCYPFELSGGMCQRAALALAMSLQPQLLIADEPTASLDIVAQSEIVLLLNNLREQLGLAMIIISHDLGLVARLADKIAVMADGKILEMSTTEQILTNPSHDYTKSLLTSMPPFDIN